MFEDSTPQSWFANLPPISRFMLCTTFVVTVLCSFGLLNPWYIILDWPLVVKKVQIWRLISNFFYVGHFSLGWIMSQWMFISFSSKLEKSGVLGVSEGSYLYFIMVLMVIIDFIAIAFNFPVGKRVNGSCLIFAIIYYWSRRFPSSPVSIWGFILQAYQLPFALLLLDILTGNSIFDDVLGLLAGHSLHYVRDILPGADRSNILHYPPKSLDNFVIYASNIMSKYIYDFSDISSHPNVIHPNTMGATNSLDRSSHSNNRGNAQPQAFSGQGFRLGNS
ncbi:Der1-like family protein [Cryptosporidium muris RN66]|uniref:Derlin n=1 Tax=Cryptosporidium muris (strain RN66) TaxID=441375 RepID=B6ACS5_CRYMR|nr:Der1-like family protein [Cryptosporidium muris RN66]EEA05929.1 Der1-like family protein [Cryptosporidium muris RN66]|eukprot:XP_002140278.1 Der1-like family protein [Cryptosporidium muris RN66]